MVSSLATPSFHLHHADSFLQLMWAAMLENKLNHQVHKVPTSITIILAITIILTWAHHTGVTAARDDILVCPLHHHHHHYITIVINTSITTIIIYAITSPPSVKTAITPPSRRHHTAITPPSHRHHTAIIPISNYQTVTTFLTIKSNRKRRHPMPYSQMPQMLPFWATCAARPRTR